MIDLLPILPLQWVLLTGLSSHTRSESGSLFLCCDTRQGGSLHSGQTNCTIALSSVALLSVDHSLSLLSPPTYTPSLTLSLPLSLLVSLSSSFPHSLPPSLALIPLTPSPLTPSPPSVSSLVGWLRSPFLLSHICLSVAVSTPHSTTPHPQHHYFTTLATLTRWQVTSIHTAGSDVEGRPGPVKRIRIPMKCV